MLNTELLRVYLHNNDEYIQNNNLDEEDENNGDEHNFAMGQASFSLKDLLRPFTRELKLRSDVFPMKRVEADQTTNLDLNKTAKKNEKAVDRFSPYLINSTYSVI